MERTRLDVALVERGLAETRAAAQRLVMAGLVFSGERRLDKPGIVVCDAAFIGLRTALPAALALAAPGAHLVALIKPQFEVGKGRVGKGGIVREPALHAEVCTTIADWLAAQPGWSVLGIT